jgi:hypothetical protein
MAADTEETSTDLKRSVSKLPMYRNAKGATLVIGGAGSEPHIETVTKELFDKFADARPQNLKTVDSRFKNHISAFYKNHVLSWPSVGEREEADFSLLIGMSLPVGEDRAIVRLLIAQRGLLRPAGPFDSVGTGRNYANSLMEEYYGVHGGIVASLISIYVIYRVKRDIPYCGKQTQLWNFDQGRTYPMMSPYIAEAESIFKQYDIESARQFVTTIDFNNSPLSTEFVEHSREKMGKIQERFHSLSQTLTDFGYGR